MSFRRVRAGARGTEPTRLGTGTRDLCRGPVTFELGRGDGREARSLLRGRSEGSMAVREHSVHSGICRDPCHI
jgi:hypothetical protein